MKINKLCFNFNSSHGHVLWHKMGVSRGARMGLGKEKNRVNFDMIRAVLSTTLGVEKVRPEKIMPE